MTAHKLLPRAAAATGALLLGATLSVPAWADADEAETDEGVESADEVDSEDPNTLVVGTSQSIETWNPFQQTYVIEHQFRQITYEPLTRLSADDYSVEPGLAEDWYPSEDGLTWTFELREDAYWHDGEQFTAEDVLYTYHIMREDEVIAARNAPTNELIAEVRAEDDFTVVFELNHPDVGIEATDQVIVPKHIWEEHEGAWSEYGNDDFPIIGIGPFQASEFSVDSFIRYTANEDYFRGEPGFDEIVFQYYTEPDTSIAALEAGEVDLIGGLNEQQIRRLEGIEHVTTNTAPDRRWLALRFNHGPQTRDREEFGNLREAITDPAVREAIHHALDREELIDRVRGGFGDPATSIVPNVFTTIWWEPSDDIRVDFDVDEANSILDEAGYEWADGEDFRTTPEGEPLALRIGVDAGNTERENTSLFLQEWLAEIGIDLERVITEDVDDQFLNGDVEMSFTGWGIQPNPVYNLNRQSCGQLPVEPGDGGTDTYYCNEEFDALIVESQQESDPERSVELYHELQEILYTDNVMIWLWYPHVMEAYNNVKITDVTTQPSDNGMIMGQSGPWAYWSAAPTGETFGGVSTGVLIGTGVVVVVAAGVIVAVLVKRKKTAEDRE